MSTKKQEKSLIRPNVSVYLGDSALYWKDFMKICKREGTNASSKLAEFIVEYVRVHGSGNPQLTITSFQPDGQQTIASIEGRIRQIFLEKHKDDSRGIYYRDIVTETRGFGIPLDKLTFMADNIEKWLHGRGVKIWR